MYMIKKNSVVYPCYYEIVVISSPQVGGYMFNIPSLEIMLMEGPQPNGLMKI